MPIQNYRAVFSDHQHGAIAPLHILTSPADTKLEPPLSEEAKAQLRDALVKADKHAATQVVLLGHSKKDIALLLNTVARKLKKSVCVVDCAELIENYIGETEKNLSKLVAKAESKGWILFFDEADALFEKRTDVKDNHHQYANQEVSYLFKILSQHPGLSIVSVRQKALAEAVEKRVECVVIHR